jgi:GTPase SAR1 family protein
MTDALSTSLADRQFRVQRAKACLARTQELFDAFGSAELKTAHARFDQLQQSLDSNRVRLVVVGEFSRGKSALLNALLGIDLLHVAKEATTAANTFLSTLPSGRDEPFIKVSYVGGRAPEEISFTDVQALKRWGTELERTHKADRELVRCIEIFLRHELLDKGLDLIDTPGFESIFAHHEEITRDAIAQAHVALWVQGTEQLGGSASEWKFLSTTLRRNFGKFITVVNKWDEVLEPKDAHEQQLGEAERNAKKLAIVQENFAKVLGAGYAEELARLTNSENLFGVSAHWAKDPDPERRRRSNIDRLAQRIADLLASGEAEEQIVLKPLKQIGEIQDKLTDHIESALVQLASDKSAEERKQELTELEQGIREMEQDARQVTDDSRVEHERAARILTERVRQELLAPLTRLRDSIEDQVTETYIRRMVAKGVRQIGLPEELGQQFEAVATGLDKTWQAQKAQMRETFNGLRASYLQAMEKHARRIESGLGQMNIRLPELNIQLDFDFSALEEHRRRTEQLHANMEELEERIETLNTEIASKSGGEQRLLQAEADLQRYQRQLDNLGPPPPPRIYDDRRKVSNWGSGFFWLRATYQTVTCTDTSQLRAWEQQKKDVGDTILTKEVALERVREEEFIRTGQRLSLEAARKKAEKLVAKLEKQAREAEQAAQQDREALIADTLNQLRRNTLGRLSESIAAIETYLSDNLRKVFDEQSKLLADCVREQMLEPLNAKRTQMEEVEALLRQGQADIAKRREALEGAQRQLAEVQEQTRHAQTA